MIDQKPVTIAVRGIEVLALKKLSLVSHALASKLPHSSAQEQRCIAGMLDDGATRSEARVRSSDIAPRFWARGSLSLHRPSPRASVYLTQQLKNGVIWLTGASAGVCPGVSAINFPPRSMT